MFLFLFCYFKSIKNIDQILLHFTLLSGKLVELSGRQKINRNEVSNYKATVGHPDTCGLPFTHLVPLNLTTQIVVCGSEASVSHGNLQKCRFSGPAPRLTDSESAF